MGTHYQDPTAVVNIFTTTVEQLIQFGFRVLVLMGGHYPWQSILNQQLPQFEAKYPNIHFLAGTEANIGGDHAAKEETAYGLALLPELVDQSTYDLDVIKPYGQTTPHPLPIDSIPVSNS